MRTTFSISIRLVAVAAWAASACSASPTVPSGPAPSFDLPRLGAPGYLRSDDLFPAHRFTFLVFWDSGCPHCTESLLGCEAFYEQDGPWDVALVGIQTGEADPDVIERLTGGHAIHFPQLWDVGGQTAQDYGISPATFTLVLVDRDQNIRGRRSDPPGDLGANLREMLSSAQGAPPSADQTPSATIGSEKPSARESLAGFVFHGDERLRFLSIDSRGETAVGAFGETIQPGNSVLYRFDFAVSRRITRRLRVGGLLRISNEDEDVLKLGPEYLGSRWGSAFAEVTTGALMLTLGYYEISMTPLTLMRWDWEDNPRIGGNAGCGCGAAAGMLLVNSLEELAPELFFEGGSASYRLAGIDARAFYAMPRRAARISYREAAATGGDRATYALELGGFEAVWRRVDSRTRSSWKIGTRVATTWEDHRSVDFIGLGYRWPDPWSSSTIATADWNVPVWRFLDFRGEWILRNKAEQNAEACCDTTYRFDGKGGVAGLVFDRPPGWKLRADYLYLDREFYSPFAALSYEPNREGARLSAQIPLNGDRVLASLFYKRLRETKNPYPGAEEEQESVVGTSVDVELSSGLGGTLGWLDDGLWRNGSIDPVDDVRKALVVDARYRFDKVTLLQFQYQRVERTKAAAGREDKSVADLYSVYFTARF